MHDPGNTGAPLWRGLLITLSASSITTRAKPIYPSPQPPHPLKSFLLEGGKRKMIGNDDSTLSRSSTMRPFGKTPSTSQRDYINRLPAEIRTMIFMLSFESSKQDKNLPHHLNQWIPIHRGLTKACTVPYTLRAVCRSWYEICVSTPVLWSCILVDVGYRETPLREVERYLNSSASSVLEITVTKREGFWETTRNEQEPPSSAHYDHEGFDDPMTDVGIIMNEEPVDEDNASAHQSSNREGSTLSQRSPFSDSDSQASVDLLQEENSHIREVMRMILPHFHRCRVLRIEVPWAHQLPLLGHDFGGLSHHLEELRLWAHHDRGDIEIEPPQPSLTLSFPNLQRLVIDGGNFRSTCLSCPLGFSLFDNCKALADVFINTDIAHDEEIPNMDLHAIMSLLSILPRLKRLGLRDLDCSVDDMELNEVPVLDELTSLSFDRIPYTVSGFILEHQASRNLTDLRVGNPYASPDYADFDQLPKVERLTVDGIFASRMIPYLVHTTSCVELNLANADADGSSSLFEELLQGSINPNDMVANLHIAPRLRALNIYDCHWPEPEDPKSPLRLLAQVARTRIAVADVASSSPVQQSTPSSIGSLHISGCGRIDDETLRSLRDDISDVEYSYESLTSTLHFTGCY